MSRATVPSPVSPPRLSDSVAVLLFPDAADSRCQRFGISLKAMGTRDQTVLAFYTQPAATIVSRDSRPLYVARPPARRLPGNCRHFTVLMTAMLRAHGTAARARCGFGGYFGTDMFEDHWVCEYWHTGQNRWILVDAQVDDVQRGWFGIDFDTTDVPRDRFLVAGQAWTRYRSGAADPAKFGLSVIGEAGDWWIAANLMRDAAALHNIEVLPWDCWGSMPAPSQPITGDLATLFDRLAAVTQEPDSAFAELRQLCSGERLRVPPTVRREVEVLEGLPVRSGGVRRTARKILVVGGGQDLSRKHCCPSRQICRPSIRGSGRHSPAFHQVRRCHCPPESRSAQHAQACRMNHQSFPVQGIPGIPGHILQQKQRQSAQRRRKEMV